MSENDTIPQRNRGGEEGEWAGGYYPSSPLLFVHAAAIPSLQVASQIMLLTREPLINTSADNLASHTSILVGGRLISGADIR